MGYGELLRREAVEDATPLRVTFPGQRAMSCVLVEHHLQQPEATRQSRPIYVITSNGGFVYLKRLRYRPTVLCLD